MVTMQLPAPVDDAPPHLSPAQVQDLPALVADMARALVLARVDLDNEYAVAAFLHGARFAGAPLTAFQSRIHHRARWIAALPVPEPLLMPFGRRPRV